MSTTATKPKAPRTIVSTKLTAGGMVTTLATSSKDLLDRAFELCDLLEQVPHFQHEASGARESLEALIAKAEGRAAK